MSNPELAASRIGKTLCGKWTLERLLGEGGMASVYAARHKIGRLDAIKILHPMYAALPQLRARFEQEAHVVNRFHHPGAVEVRDIDASEDGSPFLVMEMLEGQTLTAKAAGGRLDLPTVLRIADEVLDVLAAAHAEGIIHRDIKPDNLFVLTSGRVKVLDFGIARVRERLNQDLKTRTGTTLGTVSYMPPEQAKGLEIDARVDVYAVGATMFRLLAGRRVHEAGTEVELLMKVVTEPAPPLSSVAPEVPLDVCKVVDRALAFDRDARYASAAAMQADVRAVAAGKPPALPVAAPEVVARREAATRADVAVAVVAPPTAVPAVPPAVPEVQKRAEEPPTRAAPGTAHEVPTVAVEAPVPSAALPTGIAPLPVTPAAETPANRRKMAAILVAAGVVVLLIILGVVAVIVWMPSSPPPVAVDPSSPLDSSPLPNLPETASAAPRAANPTSRATAPTLIGAVPASPPPGALPVPPAQPPPTPATPPGHGGKGHGHPH